ncbi:peptidase C39 [Calothrix sp. 336/3]|nr:peptidase C39 [Calothrix sp. 336/3]
MQAFQLGDVIHSYIPEKQVDGDDCYLYLVCQGRVRLLGYDSTVGREVSTQLLLPEATFGADFCFFPCSLAYRAIAANSVTVARIALADWKRIEPELPLLQQYWQQATQERQTLIFLKTLTELRTETSQTLGRLLPLLSQTQVRAGCSLTEFAAAVPGRFWLLRGKIADQQGKTKPLSVGESWGYPDLNVPEGMAQTDLLLYHLSEENWEAGVAICSQLANPSSLVSESVLSVVTEPAKTDAVSVVAESLNTQENPPTENTLPTSENTLIASFEDGEIDFVSPGTSRWLKAGLWRAYPFIPQQGNSDCGAACLAMVSRYWGKRFSINNLRNLAQTNQQGASLPALAHAAEELGYDALAVRASLHKLELQTYPWIAHWQGIHYVVVWYIRGDRVLISDPALGKRPIPRQEFITHWTGYALLLSPTERLDARENDKISLAGYGKAFWRYRHLLWQIFLASLLWQLFGLATPIFTQIALDQILPSQSVMTLNWLALGFLFFGIWRLTLRAVRQYLLDYFANCTDLSIFGSVIAHTLRLPMQFFRDRPVSDILTRIQENRRIQLFFTRRAITTTLDALMVVISLGLLASYNLPLTLVVILTVLPIVCLTLAASPQLKTISRQLWHKSAAQTVAMTEMFKGIATVKTAVIERPLRWLWEEHFSEMVQARFRGQVLANNLQLTSSLVNHLGSTVVLWYGATLVIHGQMSLGKFVAFNLLIGNVITPVLGLVELWEELQEVLISLERLNDVLTTKPEETSQTPLLVMPPIQGEIRLENVSFGYHPTEKRPTLANISFSIPPGKTVGIIGVGGAGKSTLANLLVGLYPPQSGCIFIDGYNIAEISPQSLRQQIGVVHDNNFLFSATVWENISLYNSDISLELAIAAAKLAEIHGFITTLPLGYKTKVGEGGVQLSPEQRQKIAIARALAKNPPILILDEATSCWDLHPERRFLGNLHRIHRRNYGSPQQTTTLILSHRINTVQDTDYILVLDRGILIEQGTHQQLMSTPGFYFHLAQQQIHL